MGDQVASGVRKMIADLSIGNDIELVQQKQDECFIPCEPLTEEQIEFVASWLTGEGYVKNG